MCFHLYLVNLKKINLNILPLPSATHSWSLYGATHSAASPPTPSLIYQTHTAGDREGDGTAKIDSNALTLS